MQYSAMYVTFFFCLQLTAWVGQTILHTHKISYTALNNTIQYSTVQYHVRDIFLLIELTAWVGQEMCALNAAIATGADDEGSLVAKALVEHHVGG